MRHLYFILVGLCVLTGCKVGPDYRPPVTSMPNVYSEERIDKTTPISDEDFLQWWTVFNDHFLNQLMEETLQANFDYRIALQQVYQARAQYWMQFTQILPEFDGDFQATRFRVSRAFANTSNSSTSGATATSVSPIQDFFQTGFDAVWEIDIFGGLRRAADAAYDTWQSVSENSRAVKIIVLSEVANVYTIICALQQKTDIATQIVSLDEELYALAKTRFEAGLADEEQLQAVRAQLESDKAALKILETSLKQNIYSLAILLGRLPETLVEDFEIKRPIPLATDIIPTSLPADLLRRRPDIRSAERALASQTELIGVAVADLFPKLSLIGSSSSFAANPLQGANIGWSSDRLSKLLTPPSFIWGIDGLVTWPIFDFGKRLSAVDVQTFLKNQAYLAYQKTVISALQEVEQSLITYFNEEERERDFEKEAAANKRTLDLTADLFQAGLADYTQVLQIRETWLLSLSQLADSQQAVTTDLIALYKALGGDW